MRAIHRRRADDAAGTAQDVEDVLPGPLLAPTIEAIVDRCIRAALHRTITPPRTRLQHVDDPGDQTPVIDPTGTAPTTWQIWLDPFPFLIA
jgi:hypothetical protein